MKRRSMVAVAALLTLGGCGIIKVKTLSDSRLRTSFVFLLFVELIVFLIAGTTLAQSAPSSRAIDAPMAARVCNQRDQDCEGCQWPQFFSLFSSVRSAKNCSTLL